MTAGRLGPEPVRLLVMAKEPRPGLVKTRLTPPYTPVQAAALAAAALADTAHAVARVPGVRRVLVFAGEPGPWMPPGMTAVRQVAGTLDERLAAAFDDAGGHGPALLIGMDTPQVTPGLLRSALGRLRTADAVFGPAIDGGWWALGLRRPDGDLIRGVTTSTPTTGADQRRRLVEAGLRVADLPTLRDVDTAGDVAAVAALAPAGRFAAALVTLRRAA